MHILHQLIKRNSKLIEQKKNTATEFEETHSGILPEYADAIQEELLDVRDEVMSAIRNRLQELYGRKYSYEELKIAADTISHELNGAPLPRKSVH